MKVASPAPVDRHWFQSKYVALLQVVITMATILSSWAIALHQGHVQLWPIPMISYCGVYRPEKFVFSIGLVCAAFLMFFFIWVIETAGKIYSSDRVAWLLGFPCAIGLMVLAVCNCEDEPELHYAGALVYFLGFSLWCICCSFQEIGLKGLTWNKDKWVYIRKIIALLNVFFTATLTVCFAIKLSPTHWLVPVSEWLAVFMTEAFALTFWFDLGDEFWIEQVKEPKDEKEEPHSY